MKVYGVLSIVIHSLIYLCLMFFSIYFKDVLGMVAWIIGFLLLGLLLLAIVKIEDRKLVVLFLNPFRKKIQINYTDINKVIIDRGGRNTRITVIGKDFTRKEYLWLQFSELKKIYKQLTQKGVNLESVGKRIS